jgi:hypothetical protein
MCPGEGSAYICMFFSCPPPIVCDEGLICVQGTCEAAHSVQEGGACVESQDLCAVGLSCSSSNYSMICLPPGTCSLASVPRCGEIPPLLVGYSCTNYAGPAGLTCAIIVGPDSTGAASYCCDRESDASD